MPLSSQQLTELVRAAKDQSVDLSPNDIETIRKSPSDSPLSQWLNTFVPTPLLTTEELQIWQYLKTNNISLNSSRSHPSQTESLTDEFLHNAITYLTASTRQLKSQTSTLQNQQSILSRHIKQHQYSHAQLNATISTLHRNSTARAQNIHFANSSHLITLKIQLRSRLDAIEKEARANQPRVTERLNADDRTLESLMGSINKSLTSGEQPDPYATDEAARIELLLKALQKAKVEEVKDRLDRLFLSTFLKSDPGTGRPEDATAGEQHSLPTNADSQSKLSEVKAEVDSLYAEIPDMAQLLISHDYGSPLRRRLEDLAHAEESLRSQRFGEAVKRIEEMTQELEGLAGEMQRAKGERLVLRGMVAEVEAVEAGMSERARAAGVQAGMETRKNRKLEGLTAETSIYRDPNTFVDKLDETAQTRRQAVSLLVDAMNATTDVEEGIGMLEERIGQVRRGIEGG